MMMPQLRKFSHSLMMMPNLGTSVLSLGWKNEALRFSLIHEKEVGAPIS